jgi:hypothetical protein
MLKIQLNYERNTIANENRKTSKLIHNNEVKARVTGITASDDKRKSTFAVKTKKPDRRFKPSFISNYDHWFFSSNS